MEIERIVRRTAVGGFLVAGGVVLSQTAATAAEAQTTPSSAPDVPLKKRPSADAAATGSPTTAIKPTARPTAVVKSARAATKPKSKVAHSTRKKPSAVKKPAASALPTKATPAKATPAKAAKPKPAAVKPTTAAPGKGTTAIVPAPEVSTSPVVVESAVVIEPVALPPLDVAPAPVTPPVPTEGPVLDVTLVATPSTGEVATAPEIGQAEPVAAGPPPGHLLAGTGTAAANRAYVSTAAQVLSAALTGTSPNGQITITIDQPLPGTVVQPGTPVLVTGTVTVGGGSSAINVIYVIDISGSTSASGGPAGACGDRNGDGDSDTILDCELLGVATLNASLGGANVDVSIVSFESSATTEDLSPAAGVQPTTRPNADADGNGVADVSDVLQTLQSGGGTNYDAALTEVQALLVAGEQNFVFFLSDGDPTSFSTGPGSPLQAIADAGGTVLTFAVGTGTSGCAAGQPLSEVAGATGGTCTEVTDPSQLSLALTGVSVTGIDRVEIEVNGFIGIATLNPLGGFSIVIPPDILVPGRNDIVARAYGADALLGQVAAADTYVLVGGPKVGAVSDDFDEFELDLLRVSLDHDRVEVASVGDVTGLLPVTGTGAAHLAATGALSFLLGGLFLGSARHLRRRRRAGVPA